MTKTYTSVYTAVLLC